ncbi:MAG: hypothetical protein WCA38_15515 [Candidatus Acidiferrales bacterium]
MNATIKEWSIGALNAVISGGAAAVGSLAAGLTVKQAAIVIGISAGVSLSKWMLQHPVPGGTS